MQTARKLLRRVLTSPLTLGQRVEACFHLMPHFAYPLMMLLSVLLLPALILMPATDVRTMLLIDLPLCIGATGSLATFYVMAERAQGGSAGVGDSPAAGADRARRRPRAAPHARGVSRALRTMAGEFVRTPKRGIFAGRYRQAAQLPLTGDRARALVSVASVVASIETEHWFATPFAMLFTVGYGYVAALVIAEQLGRRREAARSGGRRGDRVSGDAPPTGAAPHEPTRPSMASAAVSSPAGLRRPSASRGRGPASRRSDRCDVRVPMDFSALRR